MKIRSDLAVLSTLFAFFMLSSPIVLASPFSGELTILKGGIPESLPGFKVSENGELVVADPTKNTISICVEKRLKAKIIWQAFPTARVERMLLEQQLDFIYPLQLTDERKINFLQTAYAWKAQIYSLSNTKVDLADRNIRVGVRVNSPEHLDAIKSGYKKISTPYDFESLARMLSLHVIDVAFVPEPVYLQLKNKWPAGTLISVENVKEVSYFLNAKDPKNLHSRFDAAMQDCRMDVGIKK